MPDILMSRVARMIASCHTYRWVMLHVWIWIKCATHMNGLCHTHGGVTSHICVSYATHVNNSCHSYESNVSHKCAPCLWKQSAVFEWCMPHTYPYIYISFAKEPYKRDNILQTRLVILRSLLIVATHVPIHIHQSTTYQWVMSHT